MAADNRFVQTRTCFFYSLVIIVFAHRPRAVVNRTVGLYKRQKKEDP